MRDFEELLKVKGTIWSKTNDGMEINMENLAAHVETFVVANSKNGILPSHLFNEMEIETDEIEPCPNCKSEKIKFFQFPMNVPNALGFDATEYHNMWINFVICKDCKSFFLMQDIMVQDGEDIPL